MSRRVGRQLYHFRVQTPVKGPAAKSTLVVSWLALSSTVRSKKTSEALLRHLRTTFEGRVRSVPLMFWGFKVPALSERSFYIAHRVSSGHDASPSPRRQARDPAIFRTAQHVFHSACDILAGSDLRGCYQIWPSIALSSPGLLITESIALSHYHAHHNDGSFRSPIPFGSSGAKRLEFERMAISSSPDLFFSSDSNKAKIGLVQSCFWIETRSIDMWRQSSRGVRELLECFKVIRRDLMNGGICQDGRPLLLSAHDYVLLLLNNNFELEPLPPLLMPSAALLEDNALRFTPTEISTPPSTIAAKRLPLLRQKKTMLLAVATPPSSNV